MLGRDARLAQPTMAHDVRPVKRLRFDRGPRTDRFDFVPQPFQPQEPTDFTTPETIKRSNSKKQPLSCAECRRLKLKCKEKGDRTFPCSSCQKRGCAQICPQGALTSGKGSRFILANTEELHAKIAEMSERIQQLEDALAHLQSSVSADNHPLLRSDLLRIKSSAELHRVQMTSAASYVTDLRQENELANSSWASSLRYSTSEPPYYDKIPSIREGIAFEYDHNSGYPELPADMLALSENFPVPWSVDMTMLQRIRNMLPPRSDVDYLCDRARQNAFWQYNLDPSETFMPNLVHHVYTSTLEDLSSRRLALLYMVMAVGSQVDVSQPIDTPRAEVYHNLARAAICQIPIMEHPDLDLMHTLFYMIWYIVVWSDKDNAPTYAWSVMGLAAKLAQILGLHRDGGGSKVIPEEVERRRFLFWELVSLDTRLLSRISLRSCDQALCLCRPPSFSRNHIDTNRPHYNNEVSSYADNPLLYLRWKHEFYEQCMNPVLEATVSTKPVPYCHILVLDGRLRDFYVPPELDMFGPEGLSNARPLLMQQVYVAAGPETLALQLHRNYFTRALNDPEPYTDKNQYAPSVVATYRSACRLLSILEIMMKSEPRLCKRVFGFWFNIFSAAVVICLLVSRAPDAPIALLAVGELQKVRQLFAEVAQENPRATRAHTLLERVIGKAVRGLTRHLKSREDSLDDMDDANELTGRAIRAQLVTSDTRSRLEPEFGPDPFEHAHPTLLACVRYANDQIRRQDPLKFIPGAELLSDEDDIMNEYFTPSNPTRIGNQNFNFDFGRSGVTTRLPLDPEWL